MRAETTLKAKILSRCEQERLWEINCSWNATSCSIPSNFNSHTLYSMMFYDVLWCSMDVLWMCCGCAKIYSDAILQLLGFQLKDPHCARRREVFMAARWGSTARALFKKAKKTGLMHSGHQKEWTIYRAMNHHEPIITHLWGLANKYLDWRPTRNSRRGVNSGPLGPEVTLSRLALRMPRSGMVLIWGKLHMSMVLGWWIMNYHELLLIILLSLLSLLLFTQMGMRNINFVLMHFRMLLPRTLLSPEKTNEVLVVPRYGQRRGRGAAQGFWLRLSGDQGIPGDLVDPVDPTWRQGSSTDESSATAKALISAEVCVTYQRYQPPST